MKKLVVLVFALVAMAGALTLPATAEDPTVNATISTKVVGITVSQSTLDYGTLMPGDTGMKPTPGYFSVTNAGSVVVDVDIRGTHTANWTLAASPGTDQFVHKFDTHPDLNSPKILTITDQHLWDDLVPADGQTAAGSVDVHLMLDMPLSTTSYATQTAGVVLVAKE